MLKMNPAAIAMTKAENEYVSSILIYDKDDTFLKREGIMDILTKMSAWEGKVHFSNWAYTEVDSPIEAEMLLGKHECVNQLVLFKDGKLVEAAYFSDIKEVIDNIT